MLKITLIQTNLHWEDAVKNKQHFNTLLDPIEETDLIILPEMFTTAFSMNSKSLAEKMDGQSLLWMKAKAKEKQAIICGSLIIEEKEKHYNRLIWMRPDGTFEKYDKRHLFRMANENDYFSAGAEKLIVELKGWKICPLVCYDLRFPVWSRNTENYDLLLYIANWPETRIKAWEKLLYARAIENQSYVAAVNRIGTDGKNIPYSGNTMVINAKGNAIWKAEDNQESIKTIELSLQQLNKFREKFPVADDQDKFKINV